MTEHTESRSRLALGFLAMPLPVKLVVVMVTPVMVLVGGFLTALMVAALPVTWPLVLILGIHVAWSVTAAVKKSRRHSLGATFTRLGLGMRHSPIATGAASGLGVVATIAVHLQTGGGVPSGAGDWVYLGSTMVGIGALAAIAVGLVQYTRGAVAVSDTAEPADARHIEEA